MASMKLQTITSKLCDWCARETSEPRLTVTIVTPRGAYRDEICEPCYKAFEDSTD